MFLPLAIDIFPPFGVSPNGKDITPAEIVLAMGFS